MITVRSSPHFYVPFEHLNGSILVYCYQCCARVRPAACGKCNCSFLPWTASLPWEYGDVGQSAEWNTVVRSHSSCADLSSSWQELDRSCTNCELTCQIESRVANRSASQGICSVGQLSTHYDVPFEHLTNHLQAQDWVWYPYLVVSYIVTFSFWFLSILKSPVRIFCLWFCTPWLDIACNPRGL